MLTSRTIVGIEPGSVQIQGPDGSTETIASRTVVWAAGVTASPLAGALAEGAGVDVDRAGRLTVEPDLSLRGHPEVIAIGDMVMVRDRKTGVPQVMPGLAPIAIQQGRYAGRLIRQRLQGKATRPFHYLDKGTLATIGRSRAVADIRGLRVGGFVAWLLWLFVHLTYLIGFENRVIVLVRWSYNFFSRGRSARWILETPELERETSEPRLTAAGSRR